MTALLEKAIAEISKLPPEKQEEVATWVLAELKSEARWSRSFDGSQNELERLGEQALVEHRAGRTMELDPDKL